MYRKSLITSLFIIAVVFAANIGVSAQTFIARGKVEMRQADGTVVPVENASIDVFRTDISLKGVTAKTNKKGEYSIAGLTFGGTFLFAASSPGAAPDIVPEVKGSMEKSFDFLLNAGDGKRLTMEEALELKKSGNYNAPGVKLTAEQIKAQEEQQKKIDEVKVKNSKIENSNKVIAAATKEGNTAFQAKDYNTAITKYTEGIEADPDYLGSAPILMNNRAVALRQRGIDHYNNYNKTKDTAEQQAAKADFQASYDSAKASLALTTNAKSVAEPEIANSIPKYKADATAALREALRLLAKTKMDMTKMDELSSLFQDAILAEPLPEKKTILRMDMADVFRETGDCNKASEEYGKILSEKPEDPDALAGRGLCLINLGYENDKNEQLQEGLNVLQHFVDVAPDTHKLKESAKLTIEGIKQEKQLAPQKTSGGKSTGKKKP
jgi:lipopolysaccharide biosynthesis regulator YciM